MRNTRPLARLNHQLATPFTTGGTYARMPDGDVMGASVQSFDTGQSVEGTARGMRRSFRRDLTTHLVMNIAAQRNRSGFLELLRACLVSSVQVHL